MKRFLAFLLVCLTLCGCSVAPAAGNTPDQGNPDAETTQPTIVTVPNAADYPENTGLVVKFEMGAEFEMVLDMYHAVLTVTSLNEAGEVLLSAIEPTGSYRNAVEIILEEAIRQEVLKRGTIINLAAYEVGDGAWTLADHCILTWPIENYQQNCGLNFICKLTPAGDCYDAHSYRDTFTYDYGDFTSTACYGSAGQEMAYAENDDGSYSEFYYLSMEDFMGCTYYPDGRFEFSHNSPLITENYTLNPDGSAFGSCETLDEAGNTTHYTCISEDGSYYDYYYENGIPVRMLGIDSDGIRRESTSYENGQIKLDIYDDPSGYYQEFEYYETGVPKRVYSRNADGATYEDLYYENGVIRFNAQTHTDGTYSEYEYYETGVIKHALTRYADGTTTEEYHDETGNPMDAPTES